MNDAELSAYFRAQQVSPQWLTLLRALATELAEQIDATSLRTLMSGVGKRWAATLHPDLAGIDTLEQLQDRLNASWASLNWGLVSLSEGNDQVEISHLAAPLAEALGDDALDWSVGLLEGFYTAVFRALGAADDMAVSALANADGGTHVNLVLGPVA